eukprot:TRINITY_DN18392_c0_g1_i1.p1 TRINITY_DN18392_c0_g1~~TRINITY_DN18392_c0_g1_i1.p1  ORF type:complete len:286 (-),score=68.60 TRINITY_DN18392_c0_g1_i1:73-876(-)
MEQANKKAKTGDSQPFRFGSNLPAPKSKPLSEKDKLRFSSSFTPAAVSSGASKPAVAPKSGDKFGRIEAEFDKSEKNRWGLTALDRDRETSEGRRRQRDVRPAFDPSSCWFCLSNPAVETHLVVSVGTEAYIALAKGGLVGEHCLIIPIQHADHLLAVSPECMNEIETYMKNLTDFFAAQGKKVVFFERSVALQAAQHTHIQAVPVPAAADIPKAFEAYSKQTGVKFEELERDKPLRQSLSRDPYFVADLPDRRLMHMIDRSQVGCT